MRSYRSRFLAVMRANEQRMTTLFSSLSAAASSEVLRHADASGIVPRSATLDLQQAVGARVSAMFLGRNRQGQRAPFDTLFDGRPMPLSPYARALWDSIGAGIRIPVEQNAAQMVARLPADMLAVMRMGRRNPFAAARAQVKETIFRPNALAQYEPAHIWVDPSGHQLSDRIWMTAGNTRRRIDMLLERSIAQGRSALDIASDLEEFLLPGRQLMDTKAPYGTDASFDAMRLARTEISRAHAQAAQASAAMNPFVAGLKWNLSGRHPKPDVCDDNAVGGVNGDGVYDFGSFPTMPAHPMCLCYASNAMRSQAESRSVLDSLRDDIRSARGELVSMVGPVQVEEFTRLLLSGQLNVTRAASALARVV